MPNDLLRETLELVQKFQESNPGKRLYVTPLGNLQLVDASPEEEAAWQQALEEAKKTLGCV